MIKANTPTANHSICTNAGCGGSLLD